MKTVYFKVVFDHTTQRFVVNFRNLPSNTYNDVLFPYSPEAHETDIRRFVYDACTGKIPEMEDLARDVAIVAELTKEIHRLQVEQGEMMRRVRARLTAKIPGLPETAIQRNPELFV